MWRVQLQSRLTPTAGKWQCNDLRHWYRRRYRRRMLFSQAPNFGVIAGAKALAQDIR